ncbi:MAG: hypothetical protein HY646_16550 [Acidobacteria bacterium]|nr:hypothetical protein [Acidobacteriota bacterium]
MRVRFWATGLVFALVIPQIARSQPQIVSPSEMRQAIERSAEIRQKNLAQVRSFFSGEPARAALKSARIDYQKIQRAVSTLTADELTRLAARTHTIQKDYAAGALSNQELTYIVIALAAAVVVLVVVAA